MQWRPIRTAELMLHGISITASALAVHSFTEFRVVRISSRKRRKAWRVDRVVTERPACYQMGNTLVMHPSLVAKLKEGA